MISYKFKCPICNSETDVICEYPNELVYCTYCNSEDNNKILMSQIAENTDVNVQMLLEDDGK